MNTRKLPTFFISHGGGPWPWMQDQTHGAYDKLESFLRLIPQWIGLTPRAVLMISAHWEEPEFTLMSHPSPPMIYDYTGFPQHTYQIKYEAPGSPLLAEQVLSLLRVAGVAARLDPKRGFDHGTYVPMAVMYPNADMPVIQLSLKTGLNPDEHLAAGRALARLRDQGVLIVGSGFSFHNLRMLGPAGKAPSAAFDKWLQQAIVTSNPEQRSIALASWEAAPAARAAHPREEHLLPLMMAVGAAEQEAATCVNHEDAFFGNCTVSSFMFGKSLAQLP